MTSAAPPMSNEAILFATPRLSIAFVARATASLIAFVAVLMVTVPPAAAQQITYAFSAEAGGQRSFFLSLPKDMQPGTTPALVMVFAGTDTTGADMQAFFGASWTDAGGMEAAFLDAIFVYPDPKWRDFPGWGGRYGGWLLGPHAGPGTGMQDLRFVAELLDWLGTTYAVDPDRVFATGHSWGGDMAAVAGCFLGDRFTAIAPIAANRPFWFDANGPADCKGHPAVWTVFGTADEHYAGQQAFAGDFGRQQDAFWARRHGCGSVTLMLNLPLTGESTTHQGCIQPVRLTLYDPAFSGTTDQPGHQPPDRAIPLIARWFADF